ncbi:MAG: ATP-binding protein [Fusobacteriaceae bacterium]
MSFKKNSLVFKIVLYNVLAIVISSVVIAFILIFSDFREREKNIKNITHEKIKLLDESVNEYFFKLKEEIIAAPNLLSLSDKDNIDRKIELLEISENIKKNLLTRKIETNDKVIISREKLIESKVDTILWILLILLIFILLFIKIFSRFIKKILRPLIKITEATTEISSGNYNYNLDVYTNELGEVHELVSSFKKMMKEVKYTQNKMSIQNIQLKENIVRIEVIERLLMGLHIESDMTMAIKTLLSALTSDMGLGYSRAMYFRYTRERDCFLGDMTCVNRNLDLEENAINKGFKFQVTELDRLIKTIRVPYQEENIIGKSLKESKVMFFNHKGYKYNLGNDLFKSLGIHNFMIIPIYSKTRNYGCILVDYFGKNKVITHEEYELTTLLAMNISIRISNKLMEEEKIDNEREFTITKLTERFLGSRNETLKVYMDIINKYKSGVRELREEFTILEPMVNKMEKENKTLKEYSEIMKDNFELLDVETIFSEIIEEQKEECDRNKVTVSIFMNYTGKVYGNRQSLKKAFYELIKNSYLSLLKSEKKEKKINIIVTKDKNIDKVKIAIIDNGIGMEENLLEKIYQPFLSVAGEVPGLGLSLVYRIVKEHFGVIKFFSKYLEGTEVRITLNAYEEETK